MTNSTTSPIPLISLRDVYKVYETAAGDFPALRGVSLDVEEGDRVTVTAVSADGNCYEGDYRYREGSSSNGEVAFDRYRGPGGEVFLGEWHEAGGPRGQWIIRIVAAE